jgi:hypothetical protein
MGDPDAELVMLMNWLIDGTAWPESR